MCQTIIEDMTECEDEFGDKDDLSAKEIFNGEWSHNDAIVDLHMDLTIIRRMKLPTWDPINKRIKAAKWKIFFVSCNLECFTCLKKIGDHS